ncbi:MAG TPA: magnesium transporter [Natronosporangium sp.]|nr:magnesium transporter [Natronosporangium sp.]
MSEPAADRTAPTGGPDAGPRLRTAADHASTRVPVAAPGEPVDDVLARLRGVRFDSAAVVAVCARDDLLVGLATIEALLAAPPSATVGQVMDPRPVTVAPDTDQEQAAWQAARHGQPGLAVVDTDGRFRGLVPTGHLLGVLLEEHQEDLARLGGVLHTATAARATTVESVPRRIWHRLPWLALGLLGAMVSAGLMNAFERQLDELVLIAFFVPGIVYLADAIGTQTEVLAIRGLSVGVGIGRIAGRETLTGLLLGVLLAAVALPVITLVWGDATVAAAVALAVAAASSVATVIALGLPWLLHRLGRDPAFGSGPLATVVQDLLSLLIYLAVAALLLA